MTVDMPTLEKSIMLLEKQLRSLAETDKKNGIYVVIIYKEFLPIQLVGMNKQKDGLTYDVIGPYYHTKGPYDDYLNSTLDKYDAPPRHIFRMQGCPAGTIVNKSVTSLEKDLFQRF